MTASPALLTKELESAMAKLRDPFWGAALTKDEAAAILAKLEALEAAQREITDLRNRLNLSEKLHGRFPVDAVQPVDTSAEAIIARLQLVLGRVKVQPTRRDTVGIDRHEVEAIAAAFLALQQRVAKLERDALEDEDRLHDALARLSEQETLLAERNRQAVAAFGECDRLRELLREARPYLDSFAQLTKHPTAGDDVLEYKARIDAAMGAKEGE